MVDEFIGAVCIAAQGLIHLASAKQMTIGSGESVDALEAQPAFEFVA